MDWGDRGTADGGSPDSQKGSRSPHQIQTTVGVSGKEGKDKIVLKCKLKCRMETIVAGDQTDSPVFTTMNPILSCPESDSDTSGLLYSSTRGRGDGGLEVINYRVRITRKPLIYCFSVCRVQCAMQCSEIAAKTLSLHQKNLWKIFFSWTQFCFHSFLKDPFEEIK